MPVPLVVPGHGQSHWWSGFLVTSREDLGDLRQSVSQAHWEEHFQGKRAKRVRHDRRSEDEFGFECCFMLTLLY